MPATERPVILVVDDSETLRIIVQERLKDSGCDVITAGSYVEARTVLQEGRIKVTAVLTDWYLGDGHEGKEVVRIARQEGVKVFVMTAAVIDPKNEPEIKTSGPDGVYGKPVDYDDLLQRIAGRA